MDNASPIDELKSEIKGLQARVEMLEQQVSCLRPGAKAMAEPAAPSVVMSEPSRQEVAGEMPQPDQATMPTIDPAMAGRTGQKSQEVSEPKAAHQPEHVPAQEKAWQSAEPTILIKQSAGAKPVRPAAASAGDAIASSSGSEGVERSFLSNLSVGPILERFGVMFVVVGLALAILYEFPHFTAVWKILSGVIIGALMIGIGVWLDKKETVENQWYGRGLIGGGWALLYFTAYAAYHFQSVRMFDNSLIDLLLLMLIATGAVAQSLSFKSETITGLSMILGLITVSLSDVTGFTLLAVVLLAGSLAYLVIRMCWYDLFVYGMTIFYGVYFFCTLPHMTSPTEVTGFWLSFFCSLFCWVVFNISMFSFGEDEDEHRHRMLAGTTLINSAAFVLSVSSQMPEAYQPLRPTFLVCLGVAYAVLAYYANAKQLFMLRSANIYLAVLLCTVALPSKLEAANLGMALLVELPLLVAFGLQYKLLPPRKFAVVLALYDIILVWFVVFAEHGFAPGDPQNIMLGITSVACLGACTALYKSPKLLAGAGVKNDDPFHFYTVATALMCTVTTQMNVPQDYLALAFALEAVVFVHIGFWLKDRVLRIAGGMSVCIMSFVALLLTVGSWNTLATLLVVAILYYLGSQYRKPEYHEVVRVGIIYSVAGTIYLTALFGQIFTSGWLSVSWAVEGMVLLFCGFQFKDKVMRVMGLSVLGLMIGKILLVDLAFAQAIYRIISFIIAGLVLLASSFLYAKLGKPATNTSDDRSNPDAVS